MVLFSIYETAVLAVHLYVFAEASTRTLTTALLPFEDVATRDCLFPE